MAASANRTVELRTVNIVNLTGEAIGSTQKRLAGKKLGVYYYTLEQNKEFWHIKH